MTHTSKLSERAVNIDNTCTLNAIEKSSLYRVKSERRRGEKKVLSTKVYTKEEIVALNAEILANHEESVNTGRTTEYDRSHEVTTEEVAADETSNETLEEATAKAEDKLYIEKTEDTKEYNTGERRAAHDKKNRDAIADYHRKCTREAVKASHRKVTVGRAYIISIHDLR